MWFWGVIVILFIVLIAYLKSPKERGKRGEERVSWVIGTTIEGKQYVINGLILENNGKTTQIDHIVINSRGIFVIETKNYSGEIYGGANSQEWTQSLAYGNVKNKFYNPLKQNATHVYCVKKVIGNIPIRSVVVMVQNNDYNIDADNVIGLSDLRRYLKNGEEVLSVKQMEKAYNQLLESHIDIKDREHIKNLKNFQRNLENGICPRCGGKLVLRDGRYGEFWGCENYPKCEFKKKCD